MPTSDYVGHPFLQRHNHIFERINSKGRFEVHVIRFNLFGKVRLATSVRLHELKDLSLKPLSLYYLANMGLHGGMIRRVVRNESIDVVVLSNLSPCFSYTLVRDSRIPCILDLPDYFPGSAAGYIFDSSSVSGRIVTQGFEEMLETIARRCTVTTAASYSLVQYARHLGANRSSYLPNGVDERFFVHQNREKIRQELGVGTDEILIGYVGSLAFWLNMRRMLFGLARAKRAGIPVRFLILGGNLHSDYVSMLRGWIEEAGLTEISILTGFVPHQEVPKYIAGMDLGVLPHDERNPVGYYAGPNKIWEYLSQGVPVLASPIPEALFYGQYLEIVSDEEGYFNRIRDFSLNPEPFIEKARKGREVAKSMVWDKSAERMERVMNEAMISS